MPIEVDSIKCKILESGYKLLDEIESNIENFESLKKIKIELNKSF